MIAQRANQVSVSSSNECDSNDDDSADDMDDDDDDHNHDDNGNDPDATPPPPSIASSSIDLDSSSLQSNSSIVGMSSDPPSTIESGESKSNDANSDKRDVDQPLSKRQKLGQL